jgi:hypothetical protein
MIFILDALSFFLIVSRKNAVLYLPNLENSRDLVKVPPAYHEVFTFLTSSHDVREDK